MSIQTFNPPDIPNIGSGGSHEYRILSAGFGDGYSQEAGDGINTKESSYNLVWSLLSVAECESIMNFLDNHGGYKAFKYTLPGHSTEQKFKCRSYSDVWEKGNKMRVVAVFEKVYDL